MMILEFFKHINMHIPSFLLFFIILQILILVKYIKNNKKWKATVRNYKNKHNSILSVKKSSEIRLGKIGENMAPFMKGWPYDPNRFRFIGSPVDGIQFTDNEIIFVEIKTGKSRLSKSQKLARDNVRKGNISFATFRVDETGTKMKKETHIRSGSRGWKVEVV